MTWVPVFDRPLPQELAGLGELAQDLRWSSSQATSRLWQWLDADLWGRTGNPSLILHTVPDSRLREGAQDEAFMHTLRTLISQRGQALEDKGWFGRQYADAALKSVAYFSMEFGLSEALPLYAGGLGILAGDYLKTASDMGVPLTGIGLFYDQGYFQQQLTPDGWQLEAYPYNDPITLPLIPVTGPDGGWLSVAIELPGRLLQLRVWQVQVGKVTLYLLDSNHPLNTPWDRAITSALYSGEKERRLIQELALGVGGWRLLQSLGLNVDVCHLNEGHAAFVVLARARQFMEQNGVGFPEALCGTRAGNLFTTHTPVAAGFDRFDAGLVRRYLEALAGPVPLDEFITLGQESGSGQFNMAFLATRGSGGVNGVSRLHGRVSQPILSPLFPRWPLAEVPVGSVTNAVHIDSWASPAALALWSQADDQAQAARNSPDADPQAPAESRRQQLAVSDQQLFDYRQKARQRLVEYVQHRTARPVLDPNALTLGFARRFAAYKRPTLLFHDVERLAALLKNSERPVQLIVAGKAHPGDDSGKHLVQTVVQIAARPDLSDRIVFLADYDMALTQQLVAGVDVWVNTPQRPMEASGTSGMKVLANGGLNLSELDGWWAEAYTPEVGWALGDGQEHGDAGWNGHEADQLYTLLEQQIVPEFYERDGGGLPQPWLRRVRASMSQLTPEFSGPRMVGEYVEKYYLPAAAAYQKRAARGGALAKQLSDWQRRLADAWPQVGFSQVQIVDGDPATVTAEVSLGGLTPEDVRVELYADGVGDGEPSRLPMTPVPARPNYYQASVPAGRPAHDYTPRVVPDHPDALIPLEEGHIAWAG